MSSQLFIRLCILLAPLEFSPIYAQRSYSILESLRTISNGLPRTYVMNGNGEGGLNLCLAPPSIDRTEMFKSTQCVSVDLRTKGRVVGAAPDPTASSFWILQARPTLLSRLALSETVGWKVVEEYAHAFNGQDVSACGSLSLNSEQKQFTMICPELESIAAWRSTDRRLQITSLTVTGGVFLDRVVDRGDGPVIWDRRNSRAYALSAALEPRAAAGTLKQTPACRERTTDFAQFNSLIYLLCGQLLLISNASHDHYSYVPLRHSFNRLFVTEESVALSDGSLDGLEFIARPTLVVAKLDPDIESANLDLLALYRYQLERNLLYLTRYPASDLESPFNQLSSIGALIRDGTSTRVIDAARLFYCKLNDTCSDPHPREFLAPASNIHASMRFETITLGSGQTLAQSLQAKVGGLRLTDIDSTKLLDSNSSTLEWLLASQGWIMAPTSEIRPGMTVRQDAPGRFTEISQCGSNTDILASPNERLTRDFRTFAVADFLGELPNKSINSLILSLTDPVSNTLRQEVFTNCIPKAKGRRLLFITDVLVDRAGSDIRLIGEYGRQVSVSQLNNSSPHLEKLISRETRAFKTAPNSTIAFKARELVPGLAATSIYGYPPAKPHETRPDIQDILRTRSGEILVPIASRSVDLSVLASDVTAGLQHTSPLLVICRNRCSLVTTEGSPLRPMATEDDYTKSLTSLQSLTQFPGQATIDRYKAALANVRIGLFEKADTVFPGHEIFLKATKINKRFSGLSNALSPCPNPPAIFEVACEHGTLVASVMDSLLKGTVNGYHIFNTQSTSQLDFEEMMLDANSQRPPINIINLSQGEDKPLTAPTGLKRALTISLNADRLMIISAGNGKLDLHRDPRPWPYTELDVESRQRTIVVGAISNTQNDAKLWAKTNHSRYWVDVLAGARFVGAGKGTNRYVESEGTSLAAPQVTAAAVLAQVAHIQIGNIKPALIYTSDILESSPFSALGGVINVGRLLRVADQSEIRFRLGSTLKEVYFNGQYEPPNDADKAIFQSLSLKSVNGGPYKVFTQNDGERPRNDKIEWKRILSISKRRDSENGYRVVFLSGDLRTPTLAIIDDVRLESCKLDLSTPLSDEALKEFGLEPSNRRNLDALDCQYLESYYASITGSVGNGVRF